MSFNRIQKLLYSEYSDFEDMVLIESPFVETSKKGTGRRQVQIALTSSKLIMAAEFMQDVRDYSVRWYPGHVDPEIETMELVFIYPIEVVSFSVWQRHRRRVLKARFHDGNPMMIPKEIYLELGGQEKTEMFWNLWCEKVRFLSPNTECESATEPSVASSTSMESLQIGYTRSLGKQTWYYYDSGFHPTDDMIGKLTYRCMAEMDSGNNELKTIYVNKDCDYSASSRSSPILDPKTAATRVNRFSEGVDEHCSSGLYLPIPSSEKGSSIRAKHHFKSFTDFCDMSVALWQTTDGPRPPRLYALTPCSDLNYCAGLLSTDKAGRYAVQLKRSQSQVRLVEERLHVLETEDLQRQQKLVTGSQSSDTVGNRTISHQLTPDDLILYFWTTDYWYKPDKINRKLAHCRAKRPEEIQKTRKRMFFSRKRTKVSADLEEKSLSQLRAALKMSQQVCAWDLDSGSLASQLTIMDAGLFLKIPQNELRMLKKQRSARNCKNLMTWLIFSHRVACLTATQILIAPDIRRRARLISRFIAVCDKCHRLGNHQSTSSVLHGLQSPAVFRLYATWAFVRQYHSTAYRTFKGLCREYRVAMLPDLAKPPYLPAAKFYLDTLLGRLLPQLASGRKNAAEGLSSWHGPKPLKVTNVDGPARSLPKILQQILSVFNIAPVDGGSCSSRSSLCRLASPTPLCAGEGDQSALSLLSSPSCPGLIEAEGILRASQKAARKYDLCTQRDAQEFLQKLPYQEHHINFQLSLRIEPPK